MSAVALQDDASRALRTQGDGFTAPLQQSAKYATGPSRHHRPFYDDYQVAKAHIMQALGDLGDDGEVFHRQVLCAVFCRPNTMPITRPDGSKSVVYLPEKEMKEDWWQHKVVLILRCGPEAFKGDDSYLKAMFGDRPPPEPGEWLFARPEAGVQINLCGDNASRPQGVDHRGQPMDIFEWDGWPCRIIPDDAFIGRLTRPHSVV